MKKEQELDKESEGEVYKRLRYKPLTKIFRKRYKRIRIYRPPRRR